MGGSLGSRLLRVHRPLISGNQVFVEGILEMTGSLVLAVKPLRIRFVVAEEQLAWLVAMQPKLAEFGMRHGNRAVIRRREFGFAIAAFPRPGVAKPELRQQMNRGVLRPAIVNRDAHENVVG